MSYWRLTIKLCRENELMNKLHQYSNEVFIQELPGEGAVSWQELESAHTVHNSLSVAHHILAPKMPEQGIWYTKHTISWLWKAVNEL